MEIYRVGKNKKGLNSTMVRFKLKRMNMNFTRQEKSQFHNGSIQIKTKYPRSANALLSQFHNGSIQISANFNEFKANKIVSIPQWFDSNIKQFIEKLFPGTSQFHNGSIQM